MKNFAKRLLIPCLLLLASLGQSQDFTFTEIENPPGFTYSSFQTIFNGKAYLSYYDLNFYQALFEYDGEVLTQLPDPAGYSYGYFLTEYEDKAYFVYYDINFNSYLFVYDGTTLSEVIVPTPNEYVIDFGFQLNGSLYFVYIEYVNFTTKLKILDNGVMLDVTLPSGFSYSDELGGIGPFQYVSLYDLNFNNFMFSFDGNSFTEIVNTPPGSNFFFPLTEIDETIYIGFYDFAFNLTIYTFDGGIFTEIPTNPNFFLQGYVGQLDGTPYFSFFDNVTYESIMFEFDGTDLIMIPNPPGYQFNYLPSQTETTFYAAYYPTFGFETALGIFEGTDVELVPGLPGYTYNSYLADYADGIMLYYFDPNFFGDLQYYDGIELIQVPPPVAGDQFQNFGFELDGQLYFSYYDFNFNSTLYLLGEPNVAPSADDNTVTTLLETPYNFQHEDFNFLDLNLDDTLQEVQIVSLPDSGYLHLNGGNVSTGFIFSGQQLDLLTFIPSNDGLGSPYTSFKFKVSDGELFSEEEYTMYINVVTSLSQEDQYFANAVDISPNPSNGNFQIEIDQNVLRGSGNMRIFNSQGVLVATQALKDATSYFSYPDLASGIYYVYIENQYGRATKKLLIQ